MNKKNNYSRREFVKQNSLAGIGAAVAMSVGPTILANCSTDTGTPAILGGQKKRTKDWPKCDMGPATDEEQVLKVLAAEYGHVRT
jgi:hypothetical protein